MKKFSKIFLTTFVLMLSISRISTAKPTNLPVNEYGKIMILAYHEIGYPEGRYRRTPENFKKDLELLLEKGYLPMSIKDYTNGNITTPKGYTPYCLSFDDGVENNFKMLPDGKIDPKSAVGVLMEMAKEHKEFIPYATFYTTGKIPFGQEDSVTEKLKFLLENNMDIGNHSYSHPNFTEMPVDEIQREIALEKQVIKSFLSDKSYEVDMFSVPYSIIFKEKSKYNYLRTGMYNNISYYNMSVAEGGWKPGDSPFIKGFNPYALPRIPATEEDTNGTNMFDFLKYFDLHPHERFISDGNTNLINGK